CLFQLPHHLRSEWWQSLGQATGVLGDGKLPGFEMFLSRVSEFLAFKRLPIPDDARCDAVVSDPGQGFLRWGRESNRPGGLLGNLALWEARSWAEEHNWPGLWGGINLGDEETSVVLINLPCRQLNALLRCRFPDQPSPAMAGELAERFLRACSDYPP